MVFGPDEQEKLDAAVWGVMFGARKPELAMRHARKVAGRAVSVDEVALNIMANASDEVDAACYRYSVTRHEVLLSLRRTLTE